MKKLLNVPTFFDEHWQGMPEFVQEEKKPHKTLIIRFRNEEDYQTFSNLINQKLTEKTKSIWYPKLIRGENINEVYISDLCNL